MNDEAGLGPPGDDLVEHLVERQVARADAFAERELEDAGGRRQRPGRDDLDRAQLVAGQLVARDDDRAVALAERCAVRKKDVAVGDGRVRAGGERRHFELACRPPIR